MRLKIIRSAFHYGIFITILLSSNHDILISREQQLINSRVHKTRYLLCFRKTHIIFYGPLVENVSHFSNDEILNDLKHGINHFFKFMGIEIIHIQSNI